MMDYLSPRVLTNQSLARRRSFQHRGHEICVEGPARTGKTIDNLRYAFARHFQYKGFMSCVVRPSSVDLDDSVRYDIRALLMKYGFDDPRSPIKQSGGPTKFDTLYINGGEMRFGGMNRPGRILGTQYDLMLLGELSQFTEEQYQIMKTRCSGSAANWRLKNGDIMFQIRGDTNPDVPDHWMYHREESGKLAFIPYDFLDNSNFFRDGRWSRVGKTTVNELDTGLDGIYHDRYFKGKRVAPEGRVFDIPESAIIDEFPPGFNSWHQYNAIDFGISAPSVTLWIAENPRTQEVIVYREWRHTQKTSIEMGLEVKQIRYNEHERILVTVIDNDEEKQTHLRRYCGISSEMVEKGPGSVVDRTTLIQQALKRGKLKFYRHLRCNSDSVLLRHKRPLDVIQEMRNAHYKKRPEADRYAIDENPVKKDDHGVDALGYWYLWREGRQRPLGFGGGGAKRNLRIV